MIAEWLSAREIAGLRSYGMPADKRRVNEWAKAEKWAARVDREGKPLARKRAGRGGGMEYHVSQLPYLIVKEFVRSFDPIRASASPNVSPAPYAVQWAWFAEQSVAAKETAEHRSLLLAKVDWLLQHGVTVGYALAIISAIEGLSQSTIARWRRNTAGIPSIHRLPFLAPRSSRTEMTRAHYSARQEIISVMRSVRYADRRRILLDVALLDVSEWVALLGVSELLGVPQW